MSKKKFDKEEYYKKVTQKQDAEAIGGIVANIIIFIVAATIIWFVIEGGKSLFSSVFNSEAKDFCSTSAEVRMAKTDYAAKQAFKECMRNY